MAINAQKLSIDMSALTYCGLDEGKSSQFVKPRHDRKYVTQRSLSTLDMSDSEGDLQSLSDDDIDDFPFEFEPDEEESHLHRQLDFEQCKIVDSSHKFPQFDLSEILQGLVLGEGSFAQIIEVKGFRLSPLEENELNSSNSSSISSSISSSSDHADLTHSMNCQRRVMAERYGDYDSARYALKRLKRKVTEDPHMLLQGVADMVTETRVLSSLTDHTNLIKMHGTARASDSPCGKDYFIVLDRLYDTLDGRIQKWRRRDRRLRGIEGMIRDTQLIKRKQLWTDRVSFAFDLSSALAYLHSNHVIHRDLKPQNIGFDHRGKQRCRRFVSDY
jgi:hypothetical protein